MQLLKALFASKKKPRYFATEVVGESQYQDALHKICGKPTTGYRKEFKARLVPENNNPHDKNAVKVEINGRLVGYLARADAKEYRGQNGDKPIDTDARICSGEGSTFGVWLLIDLAGYHRKKKAVRK